MKTRKKLFKNLTLQQKISLYLLSLGCIRVQCKTRKYFCFHVNPDRYYFIGSAGAVRVNNHKAVSGSTSITDRMKKTVKKWAEFKNPKEWIELQPIYFEEYDL